MWKYPLSLLVVVIALAAAPAALADPPDSGATEQQFNTNGKALGPPVEVDPAAHRPSHADEIVAARRPASHGTTGCKNVDAWRNVYSTLGALVFRFHQTKYFCWNVGHTVYNVRAGAYSSHVAWPWTYRGVISAFGYPFTWCCGNGSSGHFSFRQGLFEACTSWCFDSEDPWVRIWTYGNGNWTYSTGV